MIYNTDAIKFLKGLKEQNQRVDLVLTDIPYGITQHENDILPPIKELYELVFSITDTFITTCQGKALKELLVHMPKGIKWYDLVWDKVNPTGFLNAKRQPLRSHENILVMYKKQPTYNPQLKKGKPLHGRGTAYLDKDEQVNNNYGEFNHKYERDTPSDMKYPKSVWGHKKPHPSVSVHPTQKPISLYEELVLTYSNKHDIILDPYMGSGTTGVSAKMHDRQFIGIEKDPDVCEVARKRFVALIEEDK